MSKKQETDSEEFDFFELDSGRLDEEWVNQPKLYFRYATRLAEAKEAHDRAKAQRDLTVAKLDRNIRTEPLAYDIPKVTEGVVEKTVLLQPLYQAATKEVIDAKARVDQLEAVVSALDHRKKALENLVYLHGQSYFATPRPPEGQKGRLSEVEKTSTRTKVKRALHGD